MAAAPDRSAQVWLRARTGSRAAEGRRRRRNPDLRSCRLPLLRLLPRILLPMILPFKSHARLALTDAGLLELIRPSAEGEHPIAGQCKARKTSEAFVPPKPKEFDSAA